MPINDKMLKGCLMRNGTDVGGGPQGRSEAEPVAAGTKVNL